MRRNKWIYNIFKLFEENQERVRALLEVSSMLVHINHHHLPLKIGNNMHKSKSLTCSCFCTITQCHTPQSQYDAINVYGGGRRTKVPTSAHAVTVDG